MDHKTEFDTILQKIRSSCCISVDELSLITDALSTLTTRRRLDQVDREWSAQIQKYVHRRTKTNRAYVPNAGENWAVMLLGAIVAGFGCYNALGSLVHDPALHIPATLAFSLLMVIGVYVLVQACKDLSLVRSYTRDLASYHAKRGTIAASLPPEDRPPGHVCTQCLAKIA